MENRNLQNISAEELFELVLSGDNDAFERLIFLYEDELSRFIYLMVCDYHEAEHLAIETFARFFLNRKKFDGKSSVKTYLFAIGKNITLRHLKKRGRERHLAFEDAVEMQIGEGETPQSVLERGENKRYLTEAMRDLKEDYRKVLLLLYFEDMSYLQAGRAMDKSEKQIKNLAYRAKAALKKILLNRNFEYA